MAHGDVDPGDRTLAAGADLLVAADGGALACESWNLRPDILVGDLDSFGVDRAEDLARAGARVEGHPVAKDESDTELAIRAALEAGADEIVLVGALGGPRLDHEVANILLLTNPAWFGRVRIVRGPTTIHALAAGDRLVLEGRPGDLVTLLPVGEATGVRTAGLRYALDGEPLRAGSTRGLSNVVATAGASVSVAAGQLLVIESAWQDPGVADIARP